MNIFKKETNIKFINKKYYLFAVSSLVILAGILVFAMRGFRMGIDFSGGTLVEASFKSRVSINEIRSMLDKVKMGDASITQISGENKFFIKVMTVSDKNAGDETIDDHAVIAKRIKAALIVPEEKSLLAAGKFDLNNNSEGEIAVFLRSKGMSEEDSNESARIIINLRKNSTGMIDNFGLLESTDLKHRVLSVLKESTFLGRFTVLSVEIVGPQVGKDLRRKAALACIWALIGMLVYIAFRFKFLYGLSGILTLLHDVLITLSFILFFNVEISLQVIAAILTLVGYSINDTIVIFDRLRDNLLIMRKDNLETILDKSVNQTLSRTIITSLTVFLTVLALFFFGGEVIHPFAFTMLVGVITGTYSSIYQSCAWLHVWEKSFMKRKK